MGKDCSTGHFPKGKKGKFQNSKGARYSKRKTSKSTAANQDNQGQILAKEDRNRYDAGGHHSDEAHDANANLPSHQTMSISGGVANRMDGCSSQLDEQCEQLNELIGELPEIVYQSQPTDAAASPARAGMPPDQGFNTPHLGRVAAPSTCFSAASSEDASPEKGQRASKRKAACDIIAGSPLLSPRLDSLPSFKLQALATSPEPYSEALPGHPPYATTASLMAAESERDNPLYFSLTGDRTQHLHYANIPVQTQQMCSTLSGIPAIPAGRGFRSLDIPSSDERHLWIPGNPSTCISSAQLEYQPSGAGTSNLTPASGMKMPDAPQLKQVLFSLSTKAAQHLQQGTHLVSNRHGARQMHSPQHQQTADLSAPGAKDGVEESHMCNHDMDQESLTKHEFTSSCALGMRTRGASGSRMKNTPSADDEKLENNSLALGRSSKYRGVTRHRRSGRWEAHIWVKEIARQVYLGGYEQEDHAAEAYDVAAIKCKGHTVKTNFSKDRYRELLSFIDKITMEELVMSVRRQSQGFARGSSRYRGVTHHPSGRWEARIGVPGSKHIYLGLFNEEEEAGRAYDKALVLLRGGSAATNFSLSDYRQQLAEYHQLQKDIISQGRQDEDAVAKATAEAIRRGLDIKSNANRSNSSLPISRRETRASTSEHTTKLEEPEAHKPGVNTEEA